MNIVVFDLETQNLFEDVGGRGNIGSVESFLRGDLVLGCATISAFIGRRMFRR